jgi:hypothetical protein
LFVVLVGDIEPDCEPVAVRMGRTGSYVSDFIFASSDLHTLSFMTIDQNIMAQSAQSEHETTKPVEREGQNREEA